MVGVAPQIACQHIGAAQCQASITVANGTSRFSHNDRTKDGVRLKETRRQLGNSVDSGWMESGLRHAYLEGLLCCHPVRRHVDVHAPLQVY